MASTRRNETNQEMTEEEKYYMDEIERIDTTSPIDGDVFILPAKLKEYLFLGGFAQADNRRDLKKRGVTHVLNCAAVKDYENNPYPPNVGVVDFAYFRGEDRNGYDILAHFEMALEFINRARDYGGRVLVHCEGGMNRSTSICIAYLMEVEGMDLLSVMEHVKKRRGIVPKNKSFRLQLVRFAASKGHLKPALTE